MSKRWIDKAMEGISQPIPFDTFNFALTLYEQAARGTMPGYHLKGGPGPDDPPGGLYLTNIPVNRGMMAVVRETKHLTEEQRQGLLWRLMHFGQVYEAARNDPRFDEHFKPSDEEGAVMVSGAFIRAAGEFRYLQTEEDIVPDMEDLFRLATLYRDDEE